MPLNHESDFAVELRKFALETAAKAYRSVSATVSSPGSVGGSLTADEVVSRAETYYKFLHHREEQSDG